MSNKMSKKMVLSSLMAALCSGVGATAIETPGRDSEGVNQNNFQNKFQSGVLNGSVNRSKPADNSQKGFSVLTLGASNLGSGTLGATFGYWLGTQNATKPNPGPHGPTQEEYNKVVSERNELKNALAILQNNDESARKIQNLEEENERLKAERDQANIYMFATKHAFDDFDINPPDKLKKSSSLIKESLSFLTRNPNKGDYSGIIKWLNHSIEELRKGGGEEYQPAIQYLLADPDGSSEKWIRLWTDNFKDFHVTEAVPVLGLQELWGASGLAKVLGEIVYWQSKLINKLDKQLKGE